MEKENFILKLAEYQDKRKKKREDILEKYNKLNFKIDSICDADTGAIFLTDEDSVIKRKKLINHPIFKIFDIDCIEAHRKYTLNLNDKVILRGPDNYYFGFCYLGDLDVRCSEIVETLNKVKIFIDNARKQIFNIKFSYDEILDVKLILLLSPPNKSTNSSLTIFITCCPGVNDLRTSCPKAFSSITLTKSFTIL